MELGLSLGDAPAPKAFFLADKSNGKSSGLGLELGFCMGLGSGEGRRRARSREEMEDEEDDDDGDEEEEMHRESSGDPPVQLELLPFSPVPRHPLAPPPPSHLLAQLGLPRPSDHVNYDASSRGVGTLDVNRTPSAEEVEEGAAAASCSSPNSGASAFQMDFTACRSDGGDRADLERASSRASDEEENGARKKLRLSKEQSAYLEESFKEHNTLNPKQKMALAKQLNLRPRQVEVWFQNRRARTKLKQTEVDCEYLKRCCEKLTEENRRLQKELQDLRALKATHPFYMHLPATTLTMCPSCERVATTTTNADGGGSSATANGSKSNPSGDQGGSGFNSQRSPNTGCPPGSRLFPFGPHPQNRQQQQSTACPRHQPSAAS